MRAFQLVTFLLLALSAKADLFDATTSGGNTIINPDPWISGPVSVSADDLYITDNGGPLLTASMSGLIVLGAAEGNQLFAPGGSFSFLLSDGGEIQGYFSATQYVSIDGLYGPEPGIGGGTPVDFDINPELAASFGGADSFSGSLEVQEGAHFVDVQLIGMSVPEPSALLLFATVIVLTIYASRYALLRSNRGSSLNKTDVASFMEQPSDVSAAGGTKGFRHMDSARWARNVHMQG
jgi:hypothetical protein